MSRQDEEASRSKERDYWDRVFARPDPWNYGGAYERRKYRHTLELMPDEPVGRALEIGCAEGMFTELLADLGERIRDVRSGPDGLLYLLTDSARGSLIRLEPAGP